MGEITQLVLISSKRRESFENTIRRSPANIVLLAISKEIKDEGGNGRDDHQKQ